MKYHVNYAHNSCKNSQIKNSQSALEIGGFDNSFKMNINDIEPDFIEKNHKIFSYSKGAGYWIWKPYIIRKALDKISEGDILFYTDSGSHFIKSMNPIFELVNTDEKGIILQELNSCFINKDWTKRDTFNLMNLDFEPYLTSIMVLASFVLLKKNDFTINFIDEWLKYSQDYRIITDSPNECGLENHNGFRDHRHDQSILSLLSVKYNIKRIADISQFGNDRRSQSEQIIDHTRDRS